MSRSPIRLVAFDMEGCLTDEPTVWEIMHRRLGTWESHGLPYWQRYLAGTLAYDDFARMDVAVWGGASADVLFAAADAVPLMKGCRDLLEALAEHAVAVAIVTNGLQCVADRLVSLFGVRHVLANRVEIQDGRLTGGIDIRVPYRGKGEALRGLMRSVGLDASQVAAIGDSLSDAAMFEVARIGVAFRGTHSSLGDAATHVVEDPDLSKLRGILLDGTG
jgi:phosphoserine phosphatase